MEADGQDMPPHRPSPSTDAVPVARNGPVLGPEPQHFIANAKTDEVGNADWPKALRGALGDITENLHGWSRDKLDDRDFCGS